MNAQTEAEQNAAPPGMNSVTPHLVCRDAAAAIEFYSAAFGATEAMRLPMPDGKIIHACIHINGAPVMLIDENVGCGLHSPQALKGTPVSLHLVVEDVDAAVERAAKAGATITLAVHDAFWGDRFGQVEDPFGHRWSLATPGEPKSAAEILEAARSAMPNA